MMRRRYGHRILVLGFDDDDSASTSGGKNDGENKLNCH